MKMAVVGALAHFAAREHLTTLQSLVAHDCINLRMPTNQNEKP
ncbi:hypothetical protein [Burkholderia territorii]|nr:hypothetical protein [Burkholderia territorii]VWC02572.1 LysR family transcriptional regulator [Burkholderia territorii]